MSDEFFKAARQEIQSELDTLGNIFLTCTSDEQLHMSSKEIEKHVHNIKGLAPMMGQVKVGEIAKICDLILKNIISKGLLTGSHRIIGESVKRMDCIFKGEIKTDDDNFRTQVRKAFPEISGL